MMKLLFMRFYYVSNKKLDKPPIKSVRRENAFINPKVSKAVMLPIFIIGKKKFVGKKKLTKEYWKGTGIKRLRMITYPTINEQEWFTYRRVKGKIKRITLYQYMKRRKLWQQIIWRTN